MKLIDNGIDRYCKLNKKKRWYEFWKPKFNYIAIGTGETEK